MKGFRARMAACGLVVALASSPALGAAPQGRHFASPEEAAQAIVAAAKAADSKELLAIFGPDAKRLLNSGDEVADRNAREHFVARYEEANKIDAQGDTKAVLIVGKDDWPFPIPMVKEEGGWRFDIDAGEEEIISRRIGQNELSTIQVCLAFVDAQREYYTRNPEKSALLHYANHFLSSKGKRDGLYWETREDEEPSPLGPLIASARSEGYKQGKAGHTPYHGYLFKILTSQGANASGGAYDYMAKGKMIGGFALLASPAEYGVSGVMTFLVNHDGVVYQKDLGPKTAAEAAKITSFNPDSSWEKVKGENPDA
jgi:hypothetical protein